MALILVAEDETETRAALARILTKAGHEVEVASSIDDAFAMAQDTRFDLVVTDIFFREGEQISPSGGVSLISWMRRQRLSGPLGWAARAPVLAISGSVGQRGNSYALNVARTVGATSLMGKPIDPGRLVSEVEALLA